MELNHEIFITPVPIKFFNSDSVLYSRIISGTNSSNISYEQFLKISVLYRYVKSV